MMARRRRRASVESLANEAQSGGIRAAVLGISDGLSTNIALILGVAGANPDPTVVKLAGVASLVAGAFSMAVGEFISMQTQVEVLERAIRDVRSLLSNEPDHAKQLLEQALAARGIDAGTAATIGAGTSADPQRAIGAYAGMALGINTRELGSPWIAAVASLVTFACGALVPLVPWFILRPPEATTVSVALGAAAAFVVGAFLGHHTDGRWLRGGLRQTIFITIAALVTFGIGRLFRIATL